MQPYGCGPQGGLRLALRLRIALAAALVVLTLRIVQNGDGEDQQPEGCEAGVTGCSAAECEFDRDHFLLLCRQARPIRAFHAAEEQAGPKAHPERTATPEEDVIPQGHVAPA